MIMIGSPSMPPGHASGWARPTKSRKPTRSRLSGGQRRSQLTRPRKAQRVRLCVCRVHVVVLRALIKKAGATPDEDLALARRRQKKLER